VYPHLFDVPGYHSPAPVTNTNSSTVVYQVSLW